MEMKNIDAMIWYLEEIYQISDDAKKMHIIEMIDILYQIKILQDYDIN